MADNSKTFVIRKLELTDIPMLKVFCSKCKDLGYKNNENFSALKLDKIVMPYGQYFIAVKDDEIFSLAGVHRFEEVSNNAWRCLFRGAQLPGHTPKWSMNIFNSGIHFTYFLYEQIKFIQSFDTTAEFYISTNLNSDTGAKSHRMNNIMMPRIAKLGVWHLFKENVLIYNVPQNLWKVDVETYLRLRNQYFE